MMEGVKAYLTHISITRVFLYIILFKIFQVLWSRRKHYILSWKLPGPVAYPLIGNLPTLLKNGLDLYEYLNEMYDYYDSVMRFWLGPILIVKVSDPDDVQVVTTSPNTLEKPSAYRFVQMWMGNGLFIAKAKIWRKHRKMIEQTFNINTLDSYMNVFNKESHILIDQLRQHANTNQYFDIWNFTCRCTLDIVGQTMLGVKFHCQQKNEKTQTYDNEYMKSTALAFDIVLARVLRVWLINESIFKRSSYYKDFMKCLKVFDNVTNAVIGSRDNREAFLKEQGLTGQRTMIDELFNDNKANKLTDKDLQDHLNTMVATGADATGNALAIIFVLLAMHPDVQEKLYKEIMENLDENDTDFISKASMNKMTYLDWVIKEGLRLFPGSSMISRFVTEDIQLKSKDITLHKGTCILVSIRSLHLDKKQWGEDARMFNPQRFATHHERHPFSFAPFSVGPRNCVGYKYGMLSMKIIMIHIMRQYRFTTDEKYEDIRCYLNIMLKKYGGCKVIMHSR